MPFRPTACTRSSTRRVETPPIQASWITATSAFSLTFLGSRNRGPGLEERRKVGALPQLGDTQLQGTDPGVERSIPVAVAVVEPLGRALVSPDADQALGIRLHQELQHRLRHATQEVALTGLLKELGQWQSVLGHRVLSVRVRASQLHPSRPARWPPHSLSEFPPRARTLPFVGMEGTQNLHLVALPHWRKAVVGEDGAEVRATS